MTPTHQLAAIANGRRIDRREIPELSVTDFRQAILAGVAGGQRVVSYFGAAGPQDDSRARACGAGG